MKKWLLICVAVLFGFEEYKLSEVDPMIAPSKDQLPAIHDLVIPVSHGESPETLTRQIDAISQAINPKSLQRVLIIGPQALVDKVKERLRAYRAHAYRVQTGDGDLRVLVDPLTSMLSFSNSRNVLICAPENVLRPILLRAHEAQLEVIAFASGEYLSKSSFTSGLHNWLLKWRALIETL